MPQAAKNKEAKPASFESPAIQDLLVPIAAFLRGSGVKQTQLLSEWRTAIRRTSGNKPRLKVVRIGFEYLDSTVVSRWLRDPVYLNRAGQPVDLPLKGKISITSLVKACHVAALPRGVVSSLVEFGSAKEISPGRYRLVLRALNFSIPNLLPFEPNFQFLVDAARASTWGSAAAGKEPRLFWQNAISTNVHRRHVPDFLRFAKQRGLTFAHEIDDWLEAHEAQNSRASGKNAKTMKRLGIGLFGICSDPK